MVEITKSKLAMWHLPGATWTWPSGACDVYCNIGKPTSGCIQPSALHTVPQTFLKAALLLARKSQLSS